MTATPQSPESRSDARWRLLALAALTALLAFRVAALALNRTDLLFDEAQYWSWAQEPAFGYFSKPPLLAWIIAAVTGPCGDQEFCVRLAAPLLYWLAGLFIYLAAETLYGARTAFWSAVVFSTVPALSFSSAIISTDVPLIACWAAALHAWVKLHGTRSWGWAVALGLAIGVGLNAKYAMVYFLLCAAFAFWRLPDMRWLLRDARLLPVLLLPLLLLSPNLLWNVENGFITFSHTAANAKWEGNPVHPGKALKFFAEQFAVFGPVLFGALLWTAWRSLRERPPDSDRMLLCFSLPVLALILVQAFLSRAHANWAASAYPAAAILVTAVMLRGGWRRLFRASLALHLAIMAGLAVANRIAPDAAFPGGADPYARALGWRGIADAVRARLEQDRYAAILTEDRWVTAELLYYLRGSAVPIRAWAPAPPPRDHYQLTRPFTGPARGPFLLVTLRPSVKYVTDRFEQARELATVQVPAGPRSRRTLHLLAVDGLKGAAPAGRDR